MTPESAILWVLYGVWILWGLAHVWALWPVLRGKLTPEQEREFWSRIDY